MYTQNDSHRAQQIVSQIIDQLIDHFKSQSDKYNGNCKNKIENHITQYKEMLTENPTTDKPFTVSEIKQCIKALKSNKSPGPDLISNEILKYIQLLLVKP